jgi:replication initiation protein RepC
MQQGSIYISRLPALPGRAITSHTLSIKTIADAFTGLPEGVKRYDLLNLVKRVGRELGFTTCLIAHLEYLIRFTQERDWLPGSRPVIYQSVTSTAQERGISERQVNNLERRLHQLGALTWRDSGNQRRYGARDEATGRIMFAYGVDLSPLGTLYGALLAEAERLDRYKRDWMQAKRRICALRRSVKRYMEAIIPLPPALQDAIETSEQALEERIVAHHALSVLQAWILELEELTVLLHERLDSAFAGHPREPQTGCEKPVKTSDYSEENFRPYYNTIQPQSSIKEDTSNVPGDTSGEMHRANARQPAAVCGCASKEAHHGRKSNQRKRDLSEDSRSSASYNTAYTGIEQLTLEQVYRAASPRFQGMVDADGSVEWKDMIQAAQRLYPALGIHSSAWAEACLEIGSSAAAVCILIAERRMTDPEQPVRSPGGFLRGCLKKARSGDLHLVQSVFGLVARAERGLDG